MASTVMAEMSSRLSDTQEHQESQNHIKNPADKQGDSKEKI